LSVSSIVPELGIVVYESFGKRLARRLVGGPYPIGQDNKRA